MAERMHSEPSTQACCADGRDDEDRSNGEKKTLVLLSTDHVGKGDDELGRGIVINFIKTFKEMGDELWRLVLLNGGVKLAVEGSEALPYLQELTQEGLGILVCGRCLETFNLAEKKKVGESANMLDIVTSMQLADKVISLA
jgi:selenium metabolism protein YedF